MWGRGRRMPPRTNKGAHEFLGAQIENRGKKKPPNKAVTKKRKITPSVSYNRGERTRPQVETVPVKTVEDVGCKDKVGTGGGDRSEKWSQGNGGNQMSCNKREARPATRGV